MSKKYLVKLSRAVSAALYQHISTDEKVLLGSKLRRSEINFLLPLNHSDRAREIHLSFASCS